MRALLRPIAVGWGTSEDRQSSGARRRRSESLARPADRARAAPCGWGSATTWHAAPRRARPSCSATRRGGLLAYLVAEVPEAGGTEVVQPSVPAASVPDARAVTL